ncbi:uncharacterized protein LOC121972297 [Zingiber officinale]|uniref:uncharacterized protein LOC121972297 n=1 Tax=Zingiber officinale TaxID=94328 RepID=UPI001C4C1E70|nr:uncharacterized protein LOC121972297 [Zingiber officinale]
MPESYPPRDSKKGKAIVLREEPEEQMSFSLRVLEEKLPKGYKHPVIGDDAIKCRVFLNTLSGSTQKWFDGLSNGSITCFQDFKTVFLCHFASRRKYQKTDNCVFALKSGSVEPLRSYIKRFNQVAQDVPSATSEILMSAFSHGLVEGEFFRSFIQESVKNFNEMLGKTASYINIEEA